MFQSLYDLEKICSARQLKMEKTILFFACNNLVLILTIFNNIVLQSFVLTFMCVPYYCSGPAEPEIVNTGFSMFSFFSSNLPERNGIMVNRGSVSTGATGAMAPIGSHQFKKMPFGTHRFSEKKDESNQKMLLRSDF